jgi:DNA-3-methyladenine glycosylase I
MPPKASSRKRCAWVGNDPLYLAYHDREWGVPLHDDRKLFEMIILEGAQAGLSWITVLKKRENYRRALDGFDARKIARYGARKKRALLNDAGIIRNRLKVDAAIGNARAFLQIVEDHGSFADFLWDFVDGRPIVNRWRTLSQVPVSTPKSDALSKALKSRGFKFVGTTICYSFMQAVGMVNDHVVTCFRHTEVAKSSKSRGKSR